MNKNLAYASMILILIGAIGVLAWQNGIKTRQYNNLLVIHEVYKTNTLQEKEAIKAQNQKKMQDLLKNVQYLGRVEILRQSIVTMPIEALMEMDINKLIEKHLGALPLNKPFHDGFKITAHYGDDVLEGYWRSHKGMDLVPTGSGIVYPTAEGKIIGIGEDEIYGKYILIQHDGYQTFYAHLKTIYWQDAEEQTVIGHDVDTNTRIGFYGNTGKVSPIIGDGSHLHYEVRWHDPVKDVYIPINPEEFFEAGEELALTANETQEDLT